MKSSIIFSVLASAAVGMVTAEGLDVKVTQAVECDRKTQNGDMVSMHYHGSLAESGKKFDASYDRNAPLTFPLGAGRVIKGWDQGLLNMCIGEKRTLTIPPELGYGSRAMGPIPAGSTLIFETELVSIKGVPTPEKIQYKDAEGEDAKPEAVKTDKIVDKIVEAAAEAADAAKTLVADTDSDQHEEL
ncbi:FK506-binding protein 2 [Geosmithia morbida]|uniref:peptidylprolyl isomerase n=1 Tax=Geosmithia morbida TaxID=1094350 RepID=A0A9P5D4Q9_9HYPO|nr:FK506-binding protein 2 [Geosmithia morbida]KAF4121744.1 FK506-binding protein 2 [Geosmithia morbida]